METTEISWRLYRAWGLLGFHRVGFCREEVILCEGEGSI